MNEELEILRKYYGASASQGASDLVYEFGDLFQALLVYPVFSPEFTTVGGYVVLQAAIDAEGGQDRLLELLRTTERRPLDVVAGYRWIEVPYQFRNLEKANHQVIELLAMRMTVTWLGALRVQYPAQKWTTRVLTPNETGSTIGVAFDNDA